MEITGTIKNVFPKQTGTSKTGKTWEKQEFLMEIPGLYPKRVLFTTIGADKIQRIAPNLVQGETRTVFFDIDCHEYNGRFYNSVTAYSVQIPSVQGAPQQVTQSSPQPCGQYQTIVQAPVVSAPIKNAPQPQQEPSAVEGEPLPF